MTKYVRFTLQNKRKTSLQTAKAMAGILWVYLEEWGKTMANYV